MFTHQVTLYKGQKRDDVIDCSSANEAELISTLVNLGKRTIEIPTDEPLLRELLPIVIEFQHRLTEAVEESVAVVPRDIREPVRQHMMAAMVS